MAMVIGTIVGMVVFGFLWYYINVNKKEGRDRLLETFIVTVIFGFLFQFLTRFLAGGG